MSAPILDVRNLSKRFGPIQAVEDVSLQIVAGEIYGLLGPNGAGKTTTISMISGLIKPDGGNVHVGGEDFWAHPAKAQKIMGVVPQEVALYEDLTGEENLVFWGQVAGLKQRESKARAREVLDELSLMDRSKTRVKTYSGGMKRRINLGCALMHRPRLLLLDEPTVGIDPQAREKILEYVRHLCQQGTAILYTTHYLEEAESLCHRIGIIDHGKILTEGTLAALQQGLGGDHLYVLESAAEKIDPDAWPGFAEHFKIIQRSDTQIVVADRSERQASEALKQLLDLPVALENVSVKRPTLNDVFLQLTGHALRENA